MTEPTAPLTQEAALTELRNQIDALDLQIQQLINARARCAQSVAEVKQRFQPDQQVVFYRPEREAQVLRRVMERNEGPLADTDMARIFREIMSVCLALEQPLRVAYPGPEGGFTEQAVRKHFGHSVQAQALAGLEPVFRAVQAGQCQYAVVPIESPEAGLVSHSLDLFWRFDLQICGEVELQLMASDDRPEGRVRYLVLGQQSVAPSGQDKTSLLLCAADQPGTLYALLEPFRQRQISLTRLETRTQTPAQQTLFYIDFEGHAEDPMVCDVLAELKAHPVQLKCLGSYPKAVL